MRPINGDKYIYAKMAYYLCINDNNNLCTVMIGHDDGSRSGHFRSRMFQVRRYKKGKGILIEAKRDAAYQGYRRDWPFSGNGDTIEFYKPSEWKKQ